MSLEPVVELWSSLDQTTRIGTLVAVVGLAILAIGWALHSALVALVGGALWTPAFSVLVADRAAKGVGR